MAKPPKYLFYLGGASLVLVAYTILSAPETTPKAKANNSFAGGGTRSKKGEDLYRPEDYTATFPAVNAAPRDAFKPLVVKSTETLKNQLTPLAPNGIPALFAGGDGNWVYTGNAEVDGVPNALLENTSTQEGVFLRPGEHWKSLTLARVSSDLIELIGPTGQRRSVRIADDSATEAPVPAATVAVAGAGTLPAVGATGQSGLSGPIGAIGATADPSLSVPAGGGRRNRGGRRANRNNNSANGAATTSGAPGNP